MKTLSLNPKNLPEQKTLIYKVSMLGFKANCKLEIKKESSGEVSTAAFVDANAFGKGKLLDLEMSSKISKDGELISYEDNDINAGRKRAWEKTDEKDILDPISMIFAFMGAESSEYESKILMGNKKIVPLSLKPFEEVQRPVPALGGGSRTLVGYNLIPKVVNPNFEKFAPAFWFDKETGILAEIGAKAPIVGRLTIKLSEIQ